MIEAERERGVVKPRAVGTDERSVTLPLLAVATGALAAYYFGVHRRAVV